MLTKKKAHAGAESIGERLARLRKERGFTQADLAERLGVSQPIVSDYERGALRLHGELIVRISGILGVSADEILGLKGSASSGRPVGRLFQRLRRIEELTAADRRTVLRLVDGLLSRTNPTRR